MNVVQRAAVSNVLLRESDRGDVQCISGGYQRVENDSSLRKVLTSRGNVMYAR